MEQNTTSVVIEQQGENKKRGALAVILAVAFVAMLGIGSTFAYLTWTGNQTPNRFTVDVPLSGDLVEPAWSKAVQGDDTGYASDGKIIPAAADQTKKDAKIAKDPYVVNTSKTGDDKKGNAAFASIRLTFQKWVADTSSTKTVANGEAGSYQTMSATEVDSLLQTYAFTAGDTATTAGIQTSNLGVGWKIVDANGGQKGAADTAYLNSTGGQVYFIYDSSIDAMDDFATDNKYPSASTRASATVSTANDTTTTSVFKNVIQVAEEQSAGDAGGFGDLLSVLKTGSAEHPGWRVLVDTTLSYSEAAGTALDASSAAASAMIGAYSNIEVNPDGNSPQNEGYHYGATSQHGSGFAKNIAPYSDATDGLDLPEVNWTNTK